MPNLITEQEARELFRKKVTQYRTQREFAEAHNLHETLIGPVLAGRTPLNDQMASSIGLRKVVMFEKK